MFSVWFIFLNLFLISINGFCPDDDDLQRHRCSCSLTNSYIQCPSLPERCQTCFQYQRLFFDEHVTNFPAEVFRFYDFFSSNPKQSMMIQIARIDILSTSTFSKIDVPQNRSLSIKISQLNSPILPTRLFEDLTVFNKGLVDIEIFNVTSSSFIVEQYAFGGMTLNYQSQFRFSILSAKDLIEFQSNAGTVMLTSYSTMDLSFSNFHRVLFDEHSFDHITQEHASQFRLDFDHFHEATMEHRSFIDLHQLDQSQFHLTLSNFQRLFIEKTLFDSVTQLNSSLIFSLYNLTDDLCLPSESFSHIEQDVNSTFQFQIQYGSNLLFTNHSVMNITQRGQSKFSLVMINMFDIYFDEQSISYFHQEDQSLFDIWIKFGNNLIFEDNAVQNIDIWRSSVMRIGFQYSSGALQIATNAFSDINEGQGGELVFQIMNSTDFYFRFNQTIRLETLEIVDRMLTNDDLCRISNIPSHIPIKLPFNQKCSCAVFFLYRRLHHTLSPTVLRDFVPSCYSSLSFDQIEKEELKCSFDQEIHNCYQMQGLIDIEIPRGLCHHQGSSMTKTSNLSTNYSHSLFIVLGVVLTAILLFLFSTQSRRFPTFHRWKNSFSYRRRQKLPIFSADSYQQLTHLAESHVDDDRSRRRRQDSPPVMKIVVKYNATTDQTEPHLQRYASDFLVTNDDDDDDDEINDEGKNLHPNEDLTLKLNTNPLSDIEINH